MINPTVEDPLDLLFLDLGSFRFVPRARRRNKQWYRADYTIRKLALNYRDPLIRARRLAFATYAYYVREYIRRRDLGEQQAELDRVRQGLESLHHPTVWREMQRQHLNYAELRELFGKAPEALRW